MNVFSYVDEFVPSSKDAMLAKVALASLAPLTSCMRGSPKMIIEVEQKQQKVPLPPGALKLLVAMLAEAVRGNSVTMIPSQKELTTQEAAGFLNVSRPFVVKLLEQGEIPFHRRGKHRHIRMFDLMRYKRRSFVNQEKASGSERHVAAAVPRRVKRRRESILRRGISDREKIELEDLLNEVMFAGTKALAERPLAKLRFLASSLDLPPYAKGKLEEANQLR